MKKLLIFLFALGWITVSTFAQDQPKAEFRAVWLTSAAGIDWPKTKAKNDYFREQQKNDLIGILDRLTTGNINAICLQVRSECDALYKSSYEPWAACLTGERGTDPGYDPLQFAIEECHKRGLELHIWVNPFRATSSGTLSTDDPVSKNAGDWLIKYNNEGSFTGQIIDPGYPEAREYVVKVVMEIINNYDVDGVVMDDYFYAYGGTTNQDKAAVDAHKPANMNVADWRRSNVDKFVQALYEQIQAVKPWVRFGMGPGGIWTMNSSAATKYGITLPTGIRGADPYTQLYCNTVEWVKQGWVDYINPQIYWCTKIPTQDYDVLCEWWANDVCEYFSNKLPNGKRVHFFPSQAAYRVYEKNLTGGWRDGVVEIKRQIDSNRKNLSSGYTGSVYFATSDYLLMFQEIRSSHYRNIALIPPMSWKSKNKLAAPTNLQLNGSILSWTHADNTERYVVYAYTRGSDKNEAMKDATNIKKVVYGNNIDITGFGDISKLTIAVVSYDRYGVEHAAATYEGTGVFNYPQEIFWELNGGTVNVDLPTYVRDTYILPTPTKKNNEFGGWYKASSFRGSALTKIESGWKGTLYAKWIEVEQEIFWELNGGSIDIDLPTFVRDTYTLPTPYKENNDFEGWYTTSDFQGDPITELPANWKGTLYAKWKPTTALHSISVNDKMEVYDILGRFVGTSLPLEKGIFLIKQGDKTYKVIL